MDKALVFLIQKQDEHYKKYRVYADVNRKIAEWMQEYADREVLPIVNRSSSIKELKRQKKLQG